MHGGSPKEFDSRENSRFLDRECEHAATHYDEQHSHGSSMTMREVKEEGRVTMGRNQHDRLLLSTFYGSLAGSAKAWVEELESILQQHNISKDDATKFSVFHLIGKAHAWWILESFPLRNAHVLSYANFTKALVKIFDEGIHKTHVEEQTQDKTLHVMDENLSTIPLHGIIMEAGTLHHILLGERLSSHTLH